MVLSKHIPRIITALVLIPLVVVAVAWLPTNYIALLFGGVVVMGAWEWTALVGIMRASGKALYVLFVSTALFLVWFLLLPHSPVFWLPAVGIWWLLVAIALIRTRSIEVSPGSVSLGWAAAGVPVLVFAWAAVVYLHNLEKVGPLLTLFLLVLIWIADSGAYFAGHRWGRTKLAPVISPGKTREGVYAALVCGVVFGLSLCWILPVIWVQLWPLLILCGLTVLFSVIGDLLESVLKRQADAKDSGELLPGHGGILDRIDSLTAAAPVFALGLWLLGVVE